MAINFEKDCRSQIYRESSVHWRGAGKIVHRPTGLQVRFECSWDNPTEPILEAKRRLQGLVDADEQFLAETVNADG